MTPIQQVLQQELRHAGFLFWGFVDFVLAWIAYALHLLRTDLGRAGLPRVAGTGILIVLVVATVAVALRLLRGAPRFLFAALVALLAARAAGLV